MEKSLRNVHVLLVHGVGRHSRLSALLRAYQAFRSNLNSAEAPTTGEDPIPDWSLAAFSEDATTPYVKLSPKPGQPSLPEAVLLYEVNYSNLAGVIRDNQPLDITRLFVGLDLAVNVARSNLRAHLRRPLSESQPETAGLERFAPDNAVLAHQLQKLTGVFVAATVPILGLPSLLLRNYTETFVTHFTRFFEDVATFTLDKNGEKLISAHVDRTIENIVKSGDFNAERDELVIVAHSLGTIVIHNYLLRHWSGKQRVKGKELDDPLPVPARLLTFGSPIGLICWMWLFLDYPGLKFDLERPTGRNYFSWDPQPGTASPKHEIQWINVVNHLDPIATAFPLDYVDLTRPAGKELAGLERGRVEHRYIKTGGAFSAASAHTAYFPNRTFREILGRTVRLRRGDPLEQTKLKMVSVEEHWANTMRDLMRLRTGLWFLGAVFIGIYLIGIALAYDEPVALLLLPLYAWPPATIAVLAFFQRLTFGGPTKRTGVEQMKALPWRDLASLPYRLRRLFGLGRTDPSPMAARPNAALRWLALFVAFVPTALAMAAPIVLAQQQIGGGSGILDLIADHPFAASFMVLVFFVYLVSFALSEFLAHWRVLVLELSKHRYPERHPSISLKSWPIYVFLSWALIFLAAWGTARLFVCWGDYGWVGSIFCHAQWGTFTILLGAAYALGFLVGDVFETGADPSGRQRFRRIRKTWNGYRSLKGTDFAHATVSPLLLLLFLLAFGWIVLFSGIRF